MNLPKAILLLAAASMIFSCAPSRAVLESPQVTPQGKLAGRAEFGLPIPTSVLGSLSNNYDAVKNSAVKSVSGDSLYISDSSYVKNASEYIIAMATDPLMPTMEMGLSYGIFNRFEIDYHWLVTGHALGARFQILNGDLKAALGAFYSWQDYELPSIIGDIQSNLGFTFKRSDITIPLMFGSKSGNPEGFRTEWGLGLQYQLSKISYGFDGSAANYVETWTSVSGDSTVQKTMAAVPVRSTYGQSFGGQANFRVGYKFVNFVMGLGVYYQNYGTFKLIDNRSISPSGVTYLPKIALEFRNF